MVFWIITGCITIAIGIILFVVSPNLSSNSEFASQMCGAITCVIGAMLILCPISIRLDYLQFEKKIEIQRNQFGIMASKEIINDNYTYIFDMLEINKELAFWQAAKAQWGIFSNAPNRVMDIKPIGLE